MLHIALVIPSLLMMKEKVVCSVKNGCPIEKIGLLTKKPLRGKFLLSVLFLGPEMLGLCPSVLCCNARFVARSR